MIILLSIYSASGSGLELIISLNTIDIALLRGKILLTAFCFYKIVLIDKICSY